MIDQPLINQTIASIQKSLAQAEPVIDSFRTLSSVLPDETCNKLQKYIVNDAQWQEMESDFYKKGRRKIPWHFDTVIEELHTAFESVTPAINKLFPKQQRHNFIGISLWEDTEGHDHDWHTDNELLSCALQLYLFDCPSELGTTFEVDNNQIALPFMHNTGYIIDHTVRPMLVHKTTGTVPAEIKRYSLYVSWSFTDKLPG